MNMWLRGIGSIFQYWHLYIYMAIVKAAVQHLNPCQVPVLAADQPLYALAKEIQWTWPILTERINL